jgi:hypothetical protein
MNHRFAWFPILILTVIGFVVLLEQGHSQGVTAQQIAEDNAANASSESQRQLWLAVAKDPSLPDLARLPVAQNPIGQRQSTTNSIKAAPALPFQLPRSIVTDLRLIDITGKLPLNVTGEVAMVKSLKGDQVILSTKNNTLTLLARINEQPIQTKTGDRVQVDALANGDPFSPRTIVGLQFPSGQKLLQLVETSDKPIKTSVKGFALTAVQTNFQANGFSTVEIKVGLSQMVRLQTGDRFVFGGGLEVTVQRSKGPPDKPILLQEGAPYTLRLSAKAIK